jgi:transposase, IS6 family
VARRLIRDPGDWRGSGRAAQGRPSCRTGLISRIWYDFLLSAKRDAEAAKRFFRKAFGQPHTVNPRTITVDKNPAYPKAVTVMKADGELWRFSRLRQCKFLNNIVEQDHRRIRRLIRPGLGFGSIWTARRTLAGYEAMAMIRKGQLRNIGGRDMRAQASFIAELFEIAA